MHRFTCIAAAAIVLAGCSEEAPQQQKQQSGERATLTPGEYEASWSVTELRSTDRETPATELSEGATGTSRGCVAEGGEIDPALFAEADGECRATDSYMRSGRISLQLECSRPGQTGQVLQSVTATSTEDGFEGEISTTTYLSGAGDYEMTRTVTGRRIGECPTPVQEDGAQ